MQIFNINYFQKALKDLNPTFYCNGNLNNITNRTIKTDSRIVKKGDCFIAIDGENHRGIDFIEQVLEQEVEVILFEEKYLKFFLEVLKKQRILVENVNFITVKNSIKAYGKIASYYFAKFSGTKIAITGSAGKTTLKEVLYQAFSLSKRVFCSEKNFNNHIGVPLNLLKIEKDYDIYLIEIGMNHLQEIDYLSSLIQPDISIITNILNAHLGNFNHLQEIAQAKSEIFNHQKVNGIAFIPEVNEINYRNYLLQQAKKNKVKVKSFSINRVVSIIRYNEKIGRFFTEFQDTKTNYLLKVKGIFPFHYSYISTAICLGEYLNIKVKSIFLHLSNLKNINRRFEIIHNHPIVIDDAYNSNPYSLQVSVDSLLKVTSGNFKQFIILGDILELGKYSRYYHEKVAQEIGNSLLFQSNKDIFFLLYGKEMKLFFKALPYKNKQYFSSFKEILKVLKSNVEKSNLYYFKASNGVNFKKLINEFLIILKTF